MGKLHHNLPKFKKIDGHLCEIRSAANSTIREIDSAMAAKSRTQKERQSLEQVREECRAILNGFVRATTALMDAID